MYMLVILIIPIIQLLLDRSLFFLPPGGFIDAWVYTGFFLDLPSYLHQFGSTYYATRLPWILPGFLLHSLLTPVAANNILHLLFYYALLIFTYMVVARVNGRFAGFFASILMAWCPGIRMAFMWDYVDVAGVVFITATLFYVECAVCRKKPALWLILSGISCACAVYTNLFLTPLFAIFSLHYLLRNRTVNRHPWGLSVFWALFGILLMTLMLGGINKVLGGSFLFFMPSVKFALVFSSHMSPWKPKNYEWVLNAYWLLIPLIALVGSLFVFFREWRNIRAMKVDFSVAVHLDLLLLSVVFFYFEPRNGILALFYYVAYILPFAVIALAVQVYNSELWSARSKQILTALMVLFFPVLHWIEGLGHFPGGLTQIKSLVVVLGLCLFSFSLLQTKKFDVVCFVIFFLSMVVVDVFVFASSGINRAYAGADTGEPQNRYALTCNAHRFIKDHEGSRKLRFWYDFNNPLGKKIFRSISSTYLWGYSMLNEKYPSIDEKDTAFLDPSSRLVVLQPEDKFPQKGIAALAAKGICLIPIGSHNFKKNNISFGVFLFDVDKGSPCRTLELRSNVRGQPRQANVP
jgi:hypothetical protein